MEETPSLEKNPQQLTVTFPICKDDEVDCWGCLLLDYVNARGGEWVEVCGSGKVELHGSSIDVIARKG
jgi:hypothetical protein